MRLTEIGGQPVWVGTIHTTVMCRCGGQASQQRAPGVGSPPVRCDGCGHILIPRAYGWRRNPLEATHA